MNVQKAIAIVAAVLITAAGMTGIADHGHPLATVASAQGISAEVATVQTLPTIHVTPTPEQLHELRAK